MTILWDLTLDGASIGDRIDTLNITHDQAAVHNAIALTAHDAELYHLADPDLLPASGRIVFYIGDRVMTFLLEERDGNETAFSLSGRSLSALDEAEYRHNIEYALTAPRMASDVVGDLITQSPIQWDLTDWALPNDFTFNGNPIEGALSIVRAVGGVLRCADDGTIVARPKWQTRPYLIPAAPALVPYDRIENLMTLSARDETGTHENEVTVDGYASNLELPLMEVEEDSPVIGEDVHIRVFWGNVTPPEVVDQYVSDGYISDFGFFSDQYEQEIAFIEGKASLARPIHELVGVDWHGASAAPVTFTAGEKEVFSDNLWGLATITYRSVYHKYRLYGHDEARLLLAFAFSGGVNISVKVKFDVGEENVAPPISEGLLTTEDAARARGVAYLDDNYYDFRVATIQAPYH
ncbi:hypothetical protein DRH14_03390, partial [Candidatus Shapirobacteria bacterium]